MRTQPGRATPAAPSWDRAPARVIAGVTVAGVAVIAWFGDRHERGHLLRWNVGVEPSPAHVHDPGRGGARGAFVEHDVARDRVRVDRDEGPAEEEIGAGELDRERVRSV